MRYIYFGSSKFSHGVITGLYKAGLCPEAIVSQPDKPKGRGLKLSPTEVSEFAQKNNITLFKPASLKKDKIKEELTSIKPDIIIVADYGKILPTWVLELPKKMCICLHPSLLPLYRGAAPIEYALINGDKQTGVTVFKINERVDAGQIILQRHIPINYDDDFFSLSRRLIEEGIDVLKGALALIERGEYTLTDQDESLATLTHKLKKEDGNITWNKTAQMIRNLIRATKGWPSAYTYYKDLLIKIIQVDAIEESSTHTPGTIIEIKKEGVSVSTGGGILKIRRLQPQAKKEMDAWAFVCGHKINVGDSFSNKRNG